MPAAGATGAPPAPGRLRSAAALVAVGLVLLAGATACSSSRPGGRAAASTTTVRGDGGRRPLPGFGQTAARVTTTTGAVVALCLLVAATKTLQDQGLMGVTDRTLGGYDGMLFGFAEPTVTEFWMRNTPLPLSIAFFDAGGHFVSATDMAPCGSGADCPTYAARSAYRSAVEVPRGRLEPLGMGAGSTLRRVPGPCAARR